MTTEPVHPLNVAPRLTLRASHTGCDGPGGAARQLWSVPPTDGLKIDLRCEAAFSRTLNPASLLIVHIPAGPTSAEVTSHGKTYRGATLGDAILILPPEAACKLTVARASDNLYLHIPVEQSKTLSVIEPALVAGDETLDGLLAIIRALSAGRALRSEAGELTLRLTRMILIHLERNFSSASFHMPASQRITADNAVKQAHPIVTLAIEYMIENMDRSITLDDIGDFVGRSPGQLGRLFKAHLGRSPYSYLLGLRIERACALLTSTSTPIAQLALDCGFANQEHLTRHFRQACDTTPAAYRRQQGWQVHQRAAS